MKVYKRNRIIYGIGIAIVIFSGLSFRYYSNIMPEWIGNYVGDILWGLMVFLCIGFIFKTWSTLKAGLTALLFSFAIEISQLYHSPWIDSIRRTFLGALILGFGFLWSDLICYTIGIMIGVFIEEVTRCIRKDILF